MFTEEPEWVVSATSNILERKQAVAGLEVLSGLIDLEIDRDNGEFPIKSLGDQLISDLQSNESRGLVIFGPPGVGKTTVRQQISEALRRLGLDLTIISHDEIVDALETGQVRDGRELPNLGESQEWGQGEREISNAELHREITKALEYETSRIIVETVAAGKIDRGIGALQRLFQEHPGEFVTLGLVADPKVLKKAKEIRALVSNSGLRDDEVPEFLKKMGIIVESSIPRSASEMGRILLKRIQAAATPREIDLIAEEFDEAALAVISNDKSDPAFDGKVLVPTNSHSLAILDPNESISYSRKIGALLRYYTAKIHGANTRGYIALNPFQSGEIHLYV